MKKELILKRTRGKQNASIEKISLYHSDLEIRSKITGELFDGEVIFVPNNKPDKDPLLAIYSRYLRIPIAMTHIIFLCDLNKTDMEVLILLMRNCINNNISVFQMHNYAEILEVSEFTVARSIAKLKKLNLIKRLKLKPTHSLFQISPYISWLGSQESLKEALIDWEWPKPSKNKEERFAKFSAVFDPIVKAERQKTFYPK